MNKLAENFTATSMYSQCDPSGNQYLLFDLYAEYHRKDNLLSLSGQNIIVNGHKSLHCSTVGWQFCCQWKDGSTSWGEMFVMKESHPIRTVKYA